MGISRKQILAKIAGNTKAINYHLDKHIPELLSKADRGLLEYWRKEVGNRISEMEEWAGRLSKSQEFFQQSAEYRRRLDELINTRLQQLG